MVDKIKSFKGLHTHGQTIFQSESGKLKVPWGMCSHHCSKPSVSKILLETKLNMIPEKTCQVLGKAMHINTSHEFCVAMKHSETITFAVYKQIGESFRLEEEGEEKVDYYGGSAACQGDSGGPLWVWTYRGKKPMSEMTSVERENVIVQAHQVGIVSRGNGCAFKNRPGAYTQVEQFRQFIKSKISTGGCLKYKKPNA